MIDFVRMRWLIRRVPKLEWDIEQKTAKATKITLVLTGMPKGKGYNTADDAKIMLIVAKDAYREVIKELETMRAELNPKIEKLTDPDEKAAMRMRYMAGYSPEWIATAIHRTPRSVYMYLRHAENRILKL